MQKNAQKGDEIEPGRTLEHKQTTNKTHAQVILFQRFTRLLDFIVTNKTHATRQTNGLPSCVLFMIVEIRRYGHGGPCRAARIYANA